MQKNNKRLLIVDDDKQIRELLVFDIAQSGYIVDCAIDGQEGLKKAFVKGRMEIATNFDYNIQVIGGSYHIDNYKYYEDFITTGVSRWGLSFSKCEYEDKVTSMNHDYNIDYGVVNENLIRLPDLTDYTEIQN